MGSDEDGEDEEEREEGRDETGSLKDMGVTAMTVSILDERPRRGDDDVFGTTL